MRVRSAALAPARLEGFEYAAKGPTRTPDPLDEDATVDLADHDGVTPYLFAARSGHHEVVTALLAADANVDLATNDGATPLLIAAANGRYDVVSGLLAARANVDLAMNDGATPLLYAAYKGRVDVVRLLVRAGADATLGDDFGPPITRICKAEGADTANRAEIGAILLSTCT